MLIYSSRFFQMSETSLDTYYEIGDYFLFLHLKNVSGVLVGIAAGAFLLLVIIAAVFVYIRLQYLLPCPFQNIQKKFLLRRKIEIKYYRNNLTL